jgi:hypothetical protein
LPKSPRGFFRDKNWNSERESLGVDIQGSTAREAHRTLVRAPKIMSFSNG